MQISIIENIKQFTDLVTVLTYTQFKALKAISMEHYNLLVNSTLNTSIGYDGINERSNHTQIITAYKIYQKDSFSEVDFIIQLNTSNKLSKEFVTDKSCKASPEQ